MFLELTLVDTYERKLITITFSCRAGFCRLEVTASTALMPLILTPIQAAPDLYKYSVNARFTRV